MSSYIIRNQRDLIAAVHLVAASEGISLGQGVIRALEEYVEQGKRRLIKEVRSPSNDVCPQCRTERYYSITTDTMHCPQCSHSEPYRTAPAAAGTV